MPEPSGEEVRLVLPGSLRRAVVGHAISEPTPDVDPDGFVVPFLQKAARRLAGRWTRSIRRYCETSVWRRGEFGGEDVHDAEVRIGTATRYIHLGLQYSEHEQEMFPTGRNEYRRYTVYGLPAHRHLTLHMNRQWRGGRLVCAGLTFGLTAPPLTRAAIVANFQATFETGGKR